MTKTQTQFRLTAVAAALVAVFGPALADDDVAALIKPDSSISIGAGGWSNDRPRLGIYDAMRDAGGYGLLDANVVKRDDDTGTWYKLKAQNFGLDNREVKAEYLRQGNVGATIEYNRITRDDPNTFHTNLQGIGSTRLIQRNSYTNDANATTGRFAPQNQTVELGTVRQQTSLGFYKSLLPGFDFDVTFKNEEKDGTRNWSRGGDQSGFFAVEPIDSTTRQLEAALSYTTPKLQLRGGYNGSWYQNNTSKMMVIGPVGAEKTVAGSNTTFLSLPLDNEAHQLFLNGGYNFTKDTRGTVKLEYTRATQNDHNPFTDVTTANGYSANLSNMSPPSSLHAQVNTSLIQLGLNSRVTKEFTLNGNLRYHNRDDQTPIIDFIGREPKAGHTAAECAPGSVTDTTANCYPTYPYVRGSYKTLSGKLEGTYRVNDIYTLVGSLEEKRQDRVEPVLASGEEKEGVVPFRHKLNETTGRLEVRRALTETVNGSASWIHAKRDGSSYTLMEPDTFTSGGVTFDMGNKINPLNVADRERDKVRLALDWSPVDALSLQFVAEGGRDKYSGQNAFGLEKGTTQLYSVDATWTVSEKLRFDAWYSYDMSKAKQTGFLYSSTGTGVAGTRQYDLEDGANSLGLGAKWAATPRLLTGANLQWIHNVSKYDTAAANLAGQTATVSNGTTDLKDITNKTVRLNLYSVYALNKNSDVRFDVTHERWKTDDWTWQATDGTPYRLGDGTYVTANPTQISNFIGVRYIYRFQ